MNLNKRIISIFLIFMCFVFSCSKKNQEEFFSEKISLVDLQIQQSKIEKALKELSKLKDKAKTSTQYISIVKRQLQLNAVPDAVITLQQGISSLPDPAVPAAVLVSILIDAGKAQEAAEYISLLRDTKYAGLGAEACLNYNNPAALINEPPQFFEQAYKLTGYQCFLQNAALILNAAGKLKEAEILRKKIPENEVLEEPLFWSYTSFDLGHFKKVFADLESSLKKAENRVLHSPESPIVDKALRHLLLAADSAFGEGDIERARAFWQNAVNFTSAAPPIVFYNLALTAPDERERVDQLISCIEQYPAYYPVIARYIREYTALHNAGRGDDIADYLEKRGFYSMKMEKMYFTSPRMVYKPEELLQKAMKTDNFDPKFLLEEFRYIHTSDKSFSDGAGDLWKILEKYPADKDIRKYVKWFFSHCRDFNSCFTVETTGSEALDAFYSGLEAAINGQDKDALAYFTAAGAEPQCASSAAANAGYIYYLQGKADVAVEAFSNAAAITEDKTDKSRLHYEAAIILAEGKAVNRACSILGYAVELDPKNYPAKVLLERLKAAK